MMTTVKRRFALLFTTLLALPGSALADPQALEHQILAMRNQLETLSRRLDQLEQVNQALREENAALAHSIERPAAEEPATGSPGEPEAVSWTDTVRWEGDFRYRYENIESDSGNRNRSRIRARAALVADLGDDFEVGIGLASGGQDPVSTNVTLGGGGSSKDLSLDLAYFEWSGLEDTRVVGGKFKQIAHSAGKNQMLWDSDWRPEGTGITWDNGRFFATALGTWIESDSAAGDEFSWIAQAGLRAELGVTRLKAGIGYHRFDTAGRGSFFGDGDFFGNSFDPVTGRYLYDYEGLQAFAELGFTLFTLPATAFAEYVQNQAVDEFDTGYTFGLKLGSARKAGGWDIGWAWEDLEADAALGLLTDSDFGGGGTDARGHILKGTYAIRDNLDTRVTYFINEVGGDAGDEEDYDRLQLDLNFRF